MQECRRPLLSVMAACTRDLQEIWRESNGFHMCSIFRGTTNRMWWLMKDEEVVREEEESQVTLRFLICASQGW